MTAKKRKKPMQAVMVAIGEIKPYWRNPRHNAETVKELKKSIAQFGFNVPVLLDSEGTIIAGHARYRAMLEMGVKEVPCIISNMDPDKAREYRVADNKIHDLSNWVLDGLLEELGDVEFAMSIPGFTETDAEALFPGFAQGEAGVGTGSMSSPVEPPAAPQPSARTEADLEADEIATLLCPHCGEEHEYNKLELLAAADAGEESE